jgi:predicted deacylase
LHDDETIVELTPPDIAPYRQGNTGIPYVTTFDSGRPGPHVMINAVTHGNELCGAIAIDFLFRNGIRPARGALTLSLANVAAFAAFDPGRPLASRFVAEDFNRIWDAATLDGKRQSSELQRARALRPAVDRADFLLDIHSMQHATAPMMLAGMLDKSLALARAVGIPDYIVRDAGHAAGARLRDYGKFGDPASPQAALLVECGQHWARGSADLAIATSLRFLAALDLIDPALAASDAGPPRQRIIAVTDTVTAAGPSFAFAQEFTGFEILAKQGTLIGRDGDREIRSPYDDCILIMPSRNLAPGQTAVRLGRFADDPGAPPAAA